jgi:hypothetical protein
VSNCETAGPISGIMVDKKAPQQSSCDSSDGAWHGADVTLQCHYTDGGSGPATQDVNLTTSVSAGSETDNAAASANGAKACDVLNNCAVSPADISGNKIDRKAPAVLCAPADGLWHSSDVGRLCTATDGGSGVAGAATFTLNTSVVAGDETDNAMTDTHTFYDVVGNSTQAGPLGGNMVDKKSPTFSCDPTDTAWHGANVDLSCTAQDGGSGLNGSSPASFTLSTTVPNGSETSNASTGSQALADAVGNSATAGPYSGNKVDLKAPTFSCDPTDSAWHGANVTLHCTAQDGGSGLNGSSPASFDLSTAVAAGQESPNASTGSQALTDAVGNSATAGPYSGNKVDKKKPTVTCGSADGAWHPGDVSIACTASDGGSGLANPADASFSLSTSVPANTEDANASTGSRVVADAVSNSDTAGPISGNKVDKKAPTYSCDPTDLNWHGANVALNCTAQDGGSGLNGSSPASFTLSTTVGSGQENPNASTGPQALTDAVGNSVTAGPYSGIKVDRKAPTVSCGSGDGLWHAADVNIACTATDGGAGLANPTDASFSLSTNVAAGTETSNASTGSRNVADAAGNSSTAGPVLGNKVDKKGPSITITAPGSGAGYTLGQTLAANYSCTDGGSGSGTCVGPVANGSNIDTASVGSKTFTVNATDALGNISTLINTYTVNYTATGTCNGDAGHAILQPINIGGDSVFKQGSTVPAKFRVCDANGVSIGTPGVVSTFVLYKTIAGTEDTLNEPVNSTTPDTAFRWDPTDKQWIFNISTKNLTKNKTYIYLITLNDGTTIQFQFGLK